MKDFGLHFHCLIETDDGRKINIRLLNFSHNRYTKYSEKEKAAHDID